MRYSSEDSEDSEASAASGDNGNNGNNVSSRVDASDSTGEDAVPDGDDAVKRVSQAPLKLQVRLGVWANSVRDTMFESSELDKWGTVISIVLFVMITGVAFQFLMIFIGSGIWWLVLGGKTPPTFSDMTDPDDVREATEFIVLMGPLASVLTYAPILFFVPFIRGKIRQNPWVRLPWRRDKHHDQDDSAASASTRQSGHKSWSVFLSIVKTLGLILLFMLMGLALVMLMQVIGAVFQWLGIGTSAVKDTPSSTITITNAVLNFMNGTAVFPLWTIFTLIIAVIIMPIIEEVVFRGLVLSELMSSSFAYKTIDMPAVETAHDDADNDSTVISVDNADTDDERNDAGRVRTRPRTVVMMIISGFLFSMVHIPGAADIPLAIVSMTVFGSLLAALDWAWRPRSIWPGVAVHIAYNAITLFLSVLVVAGVL